MEGGLKKEVWKIFSVASFLFITIFFILPYLVQISTYFHENAHAKELTKYGVNNVYHINLLETIPNFFNPRVEKLGAINFDLNQYSALDKYQKMDINIAGIVSDLRFLFLIGIYLSLINVYIFYRLRFKKYVNLNLVLAVNWLLFMWLLALIQITVSNITYSAGDIYQLVRVIG